MDQHLPDIQDELARIESLAPAERADALERLEQRLREALESIPPA